MDYYSILGVSRSSSEQEIKQAYKRLAMKHHPDRGGDSSTFQKIQEAYQILSDPKKRAEYDNPQRMFHTENFEDLFSYMRRRRNRDITIHVKIDLCDVFKGKSLLAKYRLFSGRQETVNIDIPAGVNNRDTIRFQGLGDDSFGGPRGNLFVYVHIQEPQGFTKEGNNLYQELKVNALDMITGSVYNLNTLEGKSLQLNIPKGIQANSRLNIKSHGFPYLKNPKNRGDLIIIVIPLIPDIEDKETLDKISEISNLYKQA